ncbi:MAG: 3-deoxy-7-phosphoheptulonate synthase [Syntrophomonadaceae bacterium]|nr:3-deoxy-7-phosphoheptulonate synthase [Syntrophomonadaceae bacterium]
MIPYKLAVRKDSSTIIQISCQGRLCLIGEGNLTVIAGPCAVESEESILINAALVKKMGAHILRGGAYKPRTSPYSFPGLGEEGLKYLALAKRETGLPVVTEVLDVRDIEKVMEVADLLQVGSRNMQNFPLLQELGRLKVPVVLKRGFAATVEEWLLAAEYIMSGGNHQVILCERGIRTFESSTRNTVDLGVVPLIKELSHLPIIVDPSHGTGRWQMVRPIAKAAIAAGADGIMIEVHHNPREALSDGDQSLNPQNFARLMTEVGRIAEMEGKRGVSCKL